MTENKFNALTRPNKAAVDRLDVAVRDQLIDAKGAFMRAHLDLSAN